MRLCSQKRKILSQREKINWRPWIHFIYIFLFLLLLTSSRFVCDFFLNLLFLVGTNRIGMRISMYMWQRRWNWNTTIIHDDSYDDDNNTNDSIHNNHGNKIDQMILKRCFFFCTIGVISCKLWKNRHIRLRYRFSYEEEKKQKWNDSVLASFFHSKITNFAILQIVSFIFIY